MDTLKDKSIIINKSSSVYRDETNPVSFNRAALVFARREVGGPDRPLMMPCRGCGLCGGSGLSARRPAVGVCQRGPGPVCPLHLPRLLLSRTLYLTGQVTCLVASGVRSSPPLTPTTLLITPGSSRPITTHPSPRIRTRDSLCSGTQWEEELRFRDRSTHPTLSTPQNSPEAATTRSLVTGPTTAPSRTATTSNHG